MDYSRFAAVPVPTIARVVEDDIGCENGVGCSNGVGCAVVNGDLSYYDPMTIEALQGIGGFGSKLKKKLKKAVKKPVEIVKKDFKKAATIVKKDFKKAATIVKRDFKKATKPLVRDFKKAGKLIKTDFKKAGAMFGGGSGGSKKPASDYAAVPPATEEIIYQDENGNVITKEQYDALMAADTGDVYQDENGNIISKEEYDAIMAWYAQEDAQSQQSPPFSPYGSDYATDSYEDQQFEEQDSNAGPAIDYYGSNAEYEDLEPTYNEDEDPAPVYDDGTPSYDFDLPMVDENFVPVPGTEMFVDYGEPIYQDYSSSDYYNHSSFWNEWDYNAEDLEGLGSLIDRRSGRPLFAVSKTKLGKILSQRLFADKKGNMFRWNGAMIERVGTLSNAGLEGWGSFRDKLAKTAKKVAGTVTPSGIAYKYLVKKKPKVHKQFHKTKRTVTPYAAIAGAAVATVYTGGAATPALIAAIGAAAAQGYKDVRTHEMKEDAEDAQKKYDREQSRLAEEQAQQEAMAGMNEVEERYELEPEGGAAPGEIPGGDYANEYDGDGIFPDFFDIDGIV